MDLSLSLKQQFKDLLSNYRPNEEVQELLSKAKIALFDGPSGSGRNAIMLELLKIDRYQQIISDTTRPPRSNNGILEQNGVEYWFKSEHEFIEGLRAGNYIEAAIIHDQQVSGVNKSEIERAITVDKIAVNDVQPDGIEAFLKYKHDTVAIFVVPPSFELWQSRLLSRGEMSGNELRRRIESAAEEINHALVAPYYSFIINEDLGEAVQLADTLCSGDRVDTTAGREVASQLLEEINQYLGRI